MSTALDPSRPRAEFAAAERDCAERLIEIALEEDLGPGEDVTSVSTIPRDAVGSARFVARAEGVLAGLPVVSLLAHQCGLGDGFARLAHDGDPVSHGQEVARLRGRMLDLLLVERTALNFLQRLSGVATVTRRFVDAVSQTRATILDTRKTLPGWRALERYAVRCGGGTNHRAGLWDAVLIKDNHLACLGAIGVPDPVTAAVASAKERASEGMVVEVEVDDLDQLDRALAARPTIVLLDNFGPELLREAVCRRDAIAPEVLLEASGGITLETVAARAATGVDRISVGALTHSAPALDFGLDYEVSGVA